MFSQQPHSPTTITHQLPKQCPQCAARLVRNRQLGHEQAAQTGAIDAIVELDVFASVETLVEHADAFEHRAAVGHRYAMRRYQPFLRTVDIGSRMVSQHRSSRQTY